MSGILPDRPNESVLHPEKIDMEKYCLTVTCKSRRGIVAAIAGYLAENGCNIIDSSQFDDSQTGNFLMRVSFISEEGVGLDALRSGFAETAETFGMDVIFDDENHRTKVIIMVSRFGHCLNDILYRWRIGALPVEIVAVISNHLDYQKLVVNHDIPFHYVKVTKENKREAEAQQMRIVEEIGAELIVLARYMQVLSYEMCEKMSGRIINIHHSFLPSFKGANPYKQAFQRRVKLIGATSHYVTADLDEGPPSNRTRFASPTPRARPTMYPSGATSKARSLHVPFTRTSTAVSSSTGTRPWYFPLRLAPMPQNGWDERVRMQRARALAEVLRPTIRPWPPPCLALDAPSRFCSSNRMAGVGCRRVAWQQ